MKPVSRSLTLAFWVLIGLFLLTSILQALAYGLSYEEPIANYFSKGAPLPVIALILSLLTIAASLLYARFFFKDPLSSLPIPYAGLASAVGYAACGIVFFASVDKTFGFVVAFAMLLAAVAEIACAILASKRAELAALIGFLPVIACILLAGWFYFDKALEMNAPLKLSAMMGILAVMLSRIQEIRVLLDRPLPRLFLFLEAALLGVGGLTALAVPIAFLFGVFERSSTATMLPYLASIQYHTPYLAGSLLILGACLTAALRLFGLSKQAKASIDETAEGEAEA